MSVHKVLAALLFLLTGARAQELRVAAASDLSAAMQKLAAAFTQKSGIQVNLALGSSGNFFAQIQNGAPFDVFLSADKSYPEKLQEAGLAEAGSLTAYARGRLVLWTSKKSGIHLQTTKERLLEGGLDALTQAEVRKIAIANPAHAPYGRAAVAALEHYKVYDQVKAKLVLGENISQTAQFAQTGNAEVGFIALSLALTPAMSKSGVYLLLPDESYPAIEQAGIVVKASGHKEQGRRFLAFLTSPEGQVILRDSGFEAPRR